MAASLIWQNRPLGGFDEVGVEDADRERQGPERTSARRFVVTVVKQPDGIRQTQAGAAFHLGAIVDVAAGQNDHLVGGHFVSPRSSLSMGGL
jgi:hypothetical protein